MKSKYMLTAQEIAEQLGVSEGHAYKIVKKLNRELDANGFVIVAGKIPKAFWEKKFYCDSTEKMMA